MKSRLAEKKKSLLNNMVKLSQQDGKQLLVAAIAGAVDSIDSFSEYDSQLIAILEQEINSEKESQLPPYSTLTNS